MKKVLLTPPVCREDSYGINRDYMNAVLRAGALPLMMPLTDSPEAMRTALDSADCLLLTGGGDIAPDRFGEARHPLCGQPDLMRDEMEWTLCEEALRRDLPLLGICRGVQLLACVLGGTLYQDIADQLPGALTHPRSDVPRDPVHTVSVLPGTLLHRIVRTDTLQVNSRHHQAVRDPGPHLAVDGRAPDGIIEAVHLPGKRFVMGVQWHPESLSDRHPEAQALFDALVNA